MDATDKQIINSLQGGFPVCDRPYAEAAKRLGIDEDDLIERISIMRDQGKLSRFGPMFNAERLGGDFCLCAMAVPQDRFEEVNALVNAHAQVAHNYERTHELNMWFVLAVEDPADIERVISEITKETGIKVYDFPKLQEFFIGLKVDV